MKMTMTRSLLILSLTCLLPALASAQGDVDAGKEKSQVCATCHGEFGNESVLPTYPKLAGQYASYLAKALEDYRSGDRENAVMQGFAATLTDEDIEDLAAYFAAQSGLKDLRIK